LKGKDLNGEIKGSSVLREKTELRVFRKICINLYSKLRKGDHDLFFIPLSNSKQNLSFIMIKLIMCHFRTITIFS
jgi:hypothetical protein